ncbi:MAG: hypothetical protein AMXMBFR34_04520 [Myxococcaceae bacterium]
MSFHVGCRGRLRSERLGTRELHHDLGGAGARGKRFAVPSAAEPLLDGHWPSGERAGKEALCKYILRPPIAQERVQLIAGELVRSTLKRLPRGDDAFTTIVETLFPVTAVTVALLPCTEVSPRPPRHPREHTRDDVVGRRMRHASVTVPLRPGHQRAQVGRELMESPALLRPSVDDSSPRVPASVGWPASRPASVLVA